jgi:hypothetical protein
MDLRNHMLQRQHTVSFLLSALCHIEIAVTNLRSAESLCKYKLLIVHFTGKDAEMNFEKVVSISKFSERRIA